MSARLFPWIRIAPVLVLLVVGCVFGRPAEVVWSDPAVSLVWPDPPETPRIRFLRSFGDPGEVDIKEEKSGRVLRWLTGESTDRLPLLSAYGITADGSGRVWVTDAGAGMVHAFDLARNKVDYLTGSRDMPFASPVGIAVDPSIERLYVADSGLGKVLVLDYWGNLLGTRQPPAGFGRPGGLACDAQGNLYAVDVLKGTVEIFSREGVHRRSLGSAAASDGRFNRPSNVFVDRQGRIFVSDAMNFHIEMFTADGASLGTIGSLGDVPGTFSRPRGVAVDSEGHVYVADAAFDNIQIFDPAGKLLLYFGGPGKSPGNFNLPAGLFFDAEDRLYVVDSYNRRIQVFQYLAAGK
jgi:DNA-binding beta-propeller fold protein YncE